MDMKKIKRFALLLIMASLAVNVQAQLEQAVKKIFAGDTVATHPTSLRRDSDSARVANLQKSLEEARLNEANMRMEMEQMMVAVSPRHCYETTHLIIRDDDFLTTAGIGDIL